MRKLSQRDGGGSNSDPVLDDSDAHNSEGSPASWQRIVESAHDDELQGQISDGKRAVNVDLIIRDMFDRDVSMRDVYQARDDLGLHDRPPNPRGWVDVADAIRARWAEDNSKAAVETLDDDEPWDGDDAIEVKP